MEQPIPQIVLNSGHRMPVVGMGTAALPLPRAGLVCTAVLDAIQLGYRHFDTAAVYGSETELGEAVAHALQHGMVGSRDELFITTKLWCADGHADLVLPALRESLRCLQLDYVDLYLVHNPVRLKKEAEKKMAFSKDDLIPMDIDATWAAMEECQQLGLAKSIGVSNFSCRKLSNLLSSAKIRPAVNQVEMHPLWNQAKLREFCTSQGIHVSAFSPFGGTGNVWGSNAVLECELLKETAQARGKTVAQVCMRWGIEQKVSIVVKSFNKERMKENIGIYDWELSDDDRQKIISLPQSRVVTPDAFVSPNGPFKTVEEFWDGEV